jgi:hypothetical protein
VKRVLLATQVVTFLRQLPPLPKARVKAGLRSLARGEGMSKRWFHHSTAIAGSVSAATASCLRIVVQPWNASSQSNGAWSTSWFWQPCGRRSPGAIEHEGMAIRFADISGKASRFGTVVTRVVRSTTDGYAARGIEHRARLRMHPPSASPGTCGSVEPGGRVEGGV